MIHKHSTSKLLRTLEPLYGAKGMVDMGNPEDTLIATLLSARTTDAQVVKIFPSVRKQFPTLQDFATAKVEEIARAISSVNFYRNKAKAIKALAQTLLDAHGGKVPSRMEDLITLPGVGRKTASCVLWYGFGIPAMAVDTHVFRITHRLGWAKGKTAEHVEQELVKIIPQTLWGTLNRVFVQFGRDVCKPITPQCWRCPVSEMCTYKNKTVKPGE